MYKLWCRGVWSEDKNLILKSIFSLNDVLKDTPVIPTSIINEEKMFSDGSWDQAKARLCVRGGI